MQLEHVRAHGGEHSPYLVVSAFAQFHLDRALVEHAQPGGATWPVGLVGERDPVLEASNCVGVGQHVDDRPVPLADVMTRRTEAVQQLVVVGDDQQSTG